MRVSCPTCRCTRRVRCRQSRCARHQPWRPPVGGGAGALHAPPMHPDATHSEVDHAACTAGTPALPLPGVPLLDACQFRCARHAHQHSMPTGAPFGNGGCTWRLLSAHAAPHCLHTMGSSHKCMQMSCLPSHAPWLPYSKPIHRPFSLPRMHRRPCNSTHLPWQSLTHTLLLCLHRRPSTMACTAAMQMRSLMGLLL